MAKLSRSHLLYFRIEVGRRLSQRFYNDDPEPYRKGFRQKDGAFRDFVVAKSAELADLGLSEQRLWQSLRAFYVVKDLPRSLVEQLVYSDVVQLTAVEDDKTRVLLAEVDRALAEYRSGTTGFAGRGVGPGASGVRARGGKTPAGSGGDAV